MGKYTVSNDNFIDNTVDMYLDSIRKCVVNYVNPKALLLSGSFGRGEGSVFYNDSDLHFLSDLEIGLVSRSPFSRLRIDRIKKSIQMEVPIPVSLFWISPRQIEKNSFKNLSFGPSIPTIHMYELKEGSSIILGSLDLSTNILDASLLPISEAIRLMENRMIEFVEKWLDKDEKKYIAFSLAKLILACGDAILLCNKLYHFSYVSRSKAFERLFSKKLFHIFDNEFLDMYKRAYEFKISPYKIFGDDDILKDLYVIKRICKETFKYILNVNNNSLSEETFGFSVVCTIPPFYRIGNFPVPDLLYDNFIATIKCWRMHRIIKWRSIPMEIKRKFSIVQQLYMCIPYLFFAIPFDGFYDQKMLEIANLWGSWSANSNNSDDYWRNLAKSVCSMWHTLC